MHFPKVLATSLSVSGSLAAPSFSRQRSNLTANSTSTEKRYAILDNDWSSVGFIPFLMALDAEIEVLALTSCTGDTWNNQIAHHALATLEIGNLSCIPVVSGATYPLINTYERFQAWESIHGVLPWEGAFAPYNQTSEALGSDPTGDPENADRLVKGAFAEGFPNTTVLQGKNAAAYMVEQVHKYPGQVSIYGAGALTNIALAVRMDDQFASLAKELVIMGGYVDDNMYQVTGTSNQADISSDINLMLDPEAAKIALTADFASITIAGNVANQVISTQEFLDEVYEVKNPYSELMYSSYGTIFPFWDETAMALMINPSLATNTTTLYLDVDTAYGSPNYGNIHVYQKAFKAVNVQNVTYVNTIDADGLKALIKQSVQYPKTCSTLGW